MGDHMVYNDASPLRVVSQKMVPNVDVLSTGVINRIIRRSDCILIAT
jgi:hypothetical protein